MRVTVAARPFNGRLAGRVERVTVDSLERGAVRLWGGEGAVVSTCMLAGGSRLQRSGAARAARHGWCAASSLGNQWPSESSKVIRDHQWSTEIIRGQQRSSVDISGHWWPSGAIRGHQKPSVVIRVISAARLMRCFQSVLLQPRLPICLLSRCNLVASSVHLLMTALPTGLVIFRRLPLQRPFIRTQTYSDAIKSQSSRPQVAIKSQ